MSIWVKFLLGVATIVGIVYVYYTEVKPVVIFGLRSDYAHAIPFQKIPEGLTSLKAESCGQCHREIYDEWKTSIHAHAYEDPFFQAYWKKDKHIWVCLNCHTPLENQQPTLIKDIPRGRVEKATQEPNPHFDAALQKESITCAACHVRDGVILGPFDDSAAPHPTKFDPSFRTAQFCSRCHNVVSGPAQFYNVGPCGTYAEYEGKYFMQERGFICQSCHMPEIDRPVAENSPIRRGRQHLWRGGHDPDMVKRAVAIQVRADPPAPKPGEQVTVTLTLMNAGAGHKIPTGDPDRSLYGGIFGGRRKSAGLDRAKLIPWAAGLCGSRPSSNCTIIACSRWPVGNTSLRTNSRPGSKELKVKTRVQYHILTDKQHEMLQTNMGSRGTIPIDSRLRAGISIVRCACGGIG